MRVVWTEEARSELDDILAYIAAQDVSAAQLVAARVLRTEKLMIRFPRAATHDPLTDTYDRYIPKTRIRLTYEIAGDEIIVLLAWHTSRDPNAKP